MSKSITNNVITNLDHQITWLENNRSNLDLVSNKRDFSRIPRKLSFKEDIKLLLSFGSKSIRKELIDYYGIGNDNVSVSALCQSRNKIKLEAFIELLKRVNSKYPLEKAYKGFHLLAVDGSDICIDTDANDLDTLLSDVGKPANLFHINGLYDVLEDRFIDCIIQNYRQANEQDALCEMAKRNNVDNVIYIADRGYEAYNVLYHLIEDKRNFIIRFKDITSKGGVLYASRQILPSKGEFDKNINIILTYKQNNEVKNNKHLYRKLHRDHKHDFLDDEHEYYEMKFRVVRFKVPETNQYECIVTNIDSNQLSADDIKYIYNLRWNIEVSYKHLKYALSMSAFHSKKRNYIKQEILAKMIMYNIDMIIINKIKENKITKSKDRKYEYTINISVTFYIINNLLSSFKKGGIPPNIDEYLANNILPIKPNRKYKRIVRSHPFVSFNYRFN